MSAAAGAAAAAKSSLPTAVIVMGVSGSGKSTIGMGLARALGWDFRDGDAFHPAANVAKMNLVNRIAADEMLQRLDVDDLGLDAMDRRYLRLIADHYGGGPVGVETLAAALSEQRDTIEDAIEPYLIQQGLLQRSPRGKSGDKRQSNQTWR